MKKSILIAVSILIFSTVSFAGKTLTLQSSTNLFYSSSSWTPNQLPGSGDTIIIPAGKKLTLSDNFSYAMSNIHIRVYGEIAFTAGSISFQLDQLSTIKVFTGGKITGTSSGQNLYLNNQLIFRGNNASVIGPKHANSTTNGFVPFGENVLPVKFVGFTITRKSNDVLIQWSTSEEMNANLYELERSFDATNWNTVAIIAAIGNSAALNNYSYTDKNITAKAVYYRIKQVDMDGRFTYTTIRSIIRSIKTESTNTVSVNITSVQGKVLLQFPQEIKGMLTVRFVSLSGQVMDQQIVNQAIGQVVLNSKVSGNYVISVSNNSDVNVAKQIIL